MIAEEIEREVQQYKDLGFENEMIEEIRLGLEHGVEVNAYANLKYDALQMREIRLGLEAGINVSLYAKEEIYWEDMARIRNYLALDKK